MVLKAPDSYVYSGPRNDLLANFMRDVPSTVHMFYNTVKYCGHRPAQKFTNGISYSTLMSLQKVLKRQKAQPSKQDKHHRMEKYYRDNKSNITINFNQEVW